jgi:hypothetical protein
MVSNALLAESDTGFSSLSSLSSIIAKFLSSNVTIDIPYCPEIKLGRLLLGFYDKSLY